MAYVEPDHLSLGLLSSEPTDSEAIAERAPFLSPPEETLPEPDRAGAPMLTSPSNIPVNVTTDKLVLKFYRHSDPTPRRSRPIPRMIHHASINHPIQYIDRSTTHHQPSDT